MKELYNKYLFYFLHASKEYLESIATGSTFKELSGSKISQIFIPLPPLPEQERIAARLDLLLGRLKIVRARLDALPEILKRFRKSVLTRAVSGALTQEWREEHASELPTAEALLAQVRAERRAAWEKAELEKLRSRGKEPKDDSWKARYKEPEPADAGELGELPDGWAWVSVVELAEKIADGVHKKPNYIIQGIPFITIKNLTSSKGIDFENVDYISETDHEVFIKRANPEADDILISKDGTLGVVRRVLDSRPFSIFVSVALVKLANKHYASYAEYAFSSEPVQNQMIGVGSGLQHIHLRDLSKDALPLPSLPEQAEIVRRVDELFAYADSLERRVEAARALAARLEPAILAKALRGELSEQIPEEAAEWERTLAALEEDAARLAAAGGAKRGRGRKMVRDPGTTAGGRAAAETPSATAPRKRGRPRKGT